MKYLPILFLFLISCQSAKQTTTETTYPTPGSVGAALYFKGTSTLTMPNDEFTIDTAGRVLFTSQQLMSEGNWREPKGVAYLEPKDADTLRMLLLNDSNLYQIKSEDVNGACPEGTMLIKLYRTDRTSPTIIETSTCAAEYNTLYGKTRKDFKVLIRFLHRCRDFYRPMYLDKKKYDLK
jgi:hypothetical protein